MVSQFALPNRGPVMVFRFPLNENAREERRSSSNSSSKRKVRVMNQISHRRRVSKSNRQAN